MPRPLVLVVVLAALLVPPAARALVMEPIPLDALAREADLVVHGTVESMASRYDDPPNDRRIVTDATVRVSRVVRGGHGSATVVMTVPGGEVGDRGQVVPGAPRLAVGDEVVVFLRGARTATLGPRRAPVGLPQGVFHVTRDGPDARPTAAQRMAGVSWGLPADRAAEPIRMDLDALVDAVRAVRSTPTPTGR
ncbi:MAG: hypothetical protein FJ087_12445 [Deltaproteobacteria bacterium]|nr:hypothetical protein [Deltaproteobacteria bacterium]